MVCVWVAVLMEAPWDSSSWIPDQNPNLSGKWYHSIFPGRCPSALSCRYGGGIILAIVKGALIESFAGNTSSLQMC